MRCRRAVRQLWPMLSRKFATAWFPGLFLLFSHVVLMFCHCVLLDEAMASWENFSCVFCFMSLLIFSKLSGVCFEVWFLFLPVGWPFHCCLFLHVRRPTERQLSCPIYWGVLLFAVLNIGISIFTLQEIRLLNPHQVHVVSLNGTSDKAEIMWQWMVRGDCEAVLPNPQIW